MTIGPNCDHPPASPLGNMLAFVPALTSLPLTVMAWAVMAWAVMAWGSQALGKLRREDMMVIRQNSCPNLNTLSEALTWN